MFSSPVVAIFDVQIPHIAFPEAFPALFRHPLAFGIVEDIQAAVLLGFEVVHKNLWDADHPDASGGFGVFRFFVGKVIAFADGDRRVGQIHVSPRQGSGFAAAQARIEQQHGGTLGVVGRFADPLLLFLADRFPRLGWRTGGCRGLDQRVVQNDLWDRQLIRSLCAGTQAGQGEV